MRFNWYIKNAEIIPIYSTNSMVEPLVGTKQGIFIVRLNISMCFLQ